MEQVSEENVSVLRMLPGQGASLCVVRHSSDSHDRMESENASINQQHQLNVEPMSEYPGFLLFSGISEDRDSTAFYNPNRSKKHAAETSDLNKRRRKKIKYSGTFLMGNLLCSILDQLAAVLRDNNQSIPENEVFDYGTEGFISVVHLDVLKTATHRTLIIFMKMKSNSPTDSRTELCIRAFGAFSEGGYPTLFFSCQDSETEGSCKHVYFLIRDIHVVQKLSSLLSIPRPNQYLSIPRGAFQISFNSTEKIRYWLSYERRLTASEVPFVVIVKEIQNGNTKRHTSLRCTECRRDPEKRGYCIHELTVIDSKKMVENKQEIV